MLGIQSFINAFQFGGRLRAKSEIQQAKVRLAIGSLIAAYLYISNQFTPDDTFTTFALYCVSFYLLVAFTLYFIIVRSPGKNPYRPVIGSILDLGIGTALMVEGGAATAWLYGGFLWTIIGAGIRFGRPYLITTTILAVIGFIVTLMLSPFWHTNIIMGIGMLVWLLVLPLYIAKLLNSLELVMRRADVANQAKSRFLASMSHEIRTPLTAIIGYAESSLNSDQDRQEHIRALSVIRQSGHHLLTIINDILDFSKIEAAEMNIEHIRVNPFKILADVNIITAAQATQKNLRFDVDYQLPLPADVYTDPVRVKQILLNLCSNAIKFTKQGAVTIYVRHLKDTNQLQCRVTDTGIGITPEQMEYIFQPFKQADSSTTRHFGGTGLGLSLSTRLAKLLGGTLEVSSQPGVGTNFTLTIPCGESYEYIFDLENIGLAAEQDLADAPGHDLYGTILLVEDNITNQKLISTMLTNMGAEVTTADNGAEAFTLAQKNTYDLIYMDMQMPIMSGIEAISELRANDYQGVIVALTANASSEDRQTCLNAGCNDYLTKPINIENLHRITARYLHHEENKVSDDSMIPIQSELEYKDTIVKDLLTDFIHELSKMLTFIKMSFVDEKWHDMSVTMHDLKGMGGGFGYPQLSELAEKIEMELKNENYKNIRDLLNELDVMYQRIYAGKFPDSVCA